MIHPIQIGAPKQLLQWALPFNERRVKNAAKHLPLKGGKKLKTNFSPQTHFLFFPFKLAMCYTLITFTFPYQISKKAGRFVTVKHPLVLPILPTTPGNQNFCSTAAHEAVLRTQNCSDGAESSSYKGTALSPRQHRSISAAPEPHAPSLVCALVICRSQSAAFSFSRPMIWRLRSLREMCSPSKVTVS